MRRTTAVAVVAAVVVAAVGGFLTWRALGPGSTDPTTALDRQCDDVPAGATRTTVTGEDGQTLGAALVGPEDARVGVVLRQGASQTICEWLPLAGRIAEETDARVLLFDRRGFGSSPADGRDLTAEPGDTLAAVRALRDAGTTGVALVGSSMGNSVVFTTLPDVSPAPCAVVSISPVLAYGDGDGSLDATSLRALPDNLWVTWETGNGGIASTAERILTQAVAQGRPKAHELAVDTTHHSIRLVEDHPEVADFVVEAIGSCR